MITNSVGEEGFRWFIGVVEDRNDPQKIGRVRVRAFNIHGNNVEAPTDTLPWATLLLPTMSGSLKGVGITPTGIQIGSTVFGFFMDGKEATMPIIFGVMPGVGDLSQLAVENQKLNKELLGPEPKSPYGTKYPFNKVVETESGHVFEVDDTPDNERIHNYHRSGTYEEIDSQGRRVNRIVGDDYEIVQKNQEIYVKGNVNIKVEGNYTLNVTGDIVINGKTINMNHGTMGAARIGDTADTGDDGTGGHFDTNAAGTNVIETGSGTVFIGD